MDIINRLDVHNFDFSSATDALCRGVLGQSLVQCEAMFHNTQLKPSWWPHSVPWAVPNAWLSPGAESPERAQAYIALWRAVAQAQLHNTCRCRALLDYSLVCARELTPVQPHGRQAVVRQRSASVSHQAQQHQYQPRNHAMQTLALPCFGFSTTYSQSTPRSGCFSACDSLDPLTRRRHNTKLRE